ncbi:MAG: hypothetical protein IPJ74_05900 [Saprospiraceae bacterium]|nr:hypothetical protein [Saprospiraceae bacterium]
MIKNLGFGLIFNLLCSLITAQNSISIADYIINQSGDSLVFENIARPELPLHYLQFQADSSSQQFWRIESDGQRRWESKDQEGWKLYALSLTAQTYMLENPLLLYPVIFEKYKIYNSKTPYTTDETTGVLTLEVNAQGFETAQAPLRNFTDCLKIEIRMSFTEKNNPVLVIEIIEWYAKNIGLVKMIKNTYYKNSRTTIAGLLQKAQLSGKPLEGRKQ